MPAVIYKRNFRVRSYECDAYGHVNNANYLRYMQEAATEASAAVGWDEARLAEVGHIWLIRETDIEYLHPLRYGDTLEITTWVGDFRRVRSRRYYELRNQAGEIVARASTDWVYVNRETGMPSSIPPEMMLNFHPKTDEKTDTTEISVPRPKFPTAPPAPAGVFTMRRLAEWRDVDIAQHVNNANYLSYMEECGIQAASHFGWSMARMKAEGVVIVARRHQIEYRLQVKQGEEVDVSTYLSDVRRSNATRHYTVTRADTGELVTQARSLWVAINPEKNQLVRMPEQMLKDFEPSIVK